MGHRIKVVVALVCAVGIGVFAAALTANPNEQESDLQDLASADKGTRLAAVNRLATRNPSVVSDLIGNLGEPRSSVVRAGLVQAIRQAGGPTAADAGAVRSLLASNDVAIRHAAVLTLLENPGIASIELTARLADTDEDSLVRRAAARALGAAGAQSRAALLRSVRDENTPSEVRKASILALARCGSAGQDDVEQMAGDADRERSEREVAVRALAASGASSALGRLASSDTAFVRAHAAAGIANSGATSAAPTLVALLSDGEAEVRLEALRALRSLKLGAENIAAVEACLNDSDVRLQSMACQMIASSGAAAFAGIQPRLRSLVDSPVFRVRLDAALALHAYGDNFGAAQMATDKDAGSLSQRRSASEAHGLIVEGN